MVDLCDASIEEINAELAWRAQKAEQDLENKFCDTLKKFQEEAQALRDKHRAWLKKVEEFSERYGIPFEYEIDWDMRATYTPKSWDELWGGLNENRNHYMCEVANIFYAFNTEGSWYHSAIC